MKKLSFTLFATALLASSLPAMAQNKNVPPSNIAAQWEPMQVVTFHSENADRENKLPPVPRVFVDLAQKIWGNEIRANGNRPSTVLMSTVQHKGNQYTFSILDSLTAPDCIAPANGRYIVDMYSLCPMRVSSIEGKTDKSKSGQFKNYCHLYPFISDKPNSKNQTQFLFDPGTSTAYFRVIQKGQLVPDCNRAIKVS